MKSNKNVSGISVVPRWAGGVGGDAGVEAAGWKGLVPVTEGLLLLAWHVGRHSPQHMNRHSLD